jgi:hypothetical protein
VTGIGSSASNLYVIGTSVYGGYSVETFSWTGTVGSTPYINSFTGLNTAYDCGFSGTLLWVAADGADSPVKAYNSSGVLQQYIPGSLVGSNARGVDFDANGYLWVSNPTTDKIYKISLSTGVEGEEGAELPSAALTAGPNPFSGTVLVQGGPAQAATIQVFDLGGRLLLDAPYSGSFTLDGGDLVPGAYLLRVSSSTEERSIRLVRI